MKPSYQSFLNFQKNSDLDINKLEKLNELLFSSSKEFKLNIFKLKRELKISEGSAKSLFLNLIKYKVLKIEHFRCNICNEVIEKLENKCFNCNTEIDYNDFYTNIDSTLDKKNLDLIKSKYNETKKANIIAREWNKQKYLIYVLIDLVNSEKIIHKIGDQNFKFFFDDIRKIIKYHSFDNVKYEYFFLGEIGDCIKIVFINKNDALTFFKNFSNKIDTSLNDSSIVKKYKKDIDYFPKFRGTADILELPNTKDGAISAESIISITLDGSIDFNTESVNKLYRLDSGISIKNKKAFKNHDISLWITENFVKETIYSEIPMTKLKVGKHKSLKKDRQVGLLLFKSGDITRIKEPKQYKK